MGKVISSQVHKELTITFIPAVRHLLTASGTFDLGGSMSDIRPTKHRSETGKFVWSVSNSYPFGNFFRSSSKWANLLQVGDLMLIRSIYAVM